MRLLIPGGIERELRTARAAVEEALRLFHHHRAADEILGPDDLGCFPASAVPSVPPIVVDANVLRNDVLYACKLEGEYTTLVNAANAGFLRLFCTTHVIEEVAEHREEWCRQKGIDAAQFEALWVEQYLPLLRLVSEVSGDLLSADERHRIGRLREVDPDDVPSATLALVIGAFYLSQDRPATTAVYGEARGLKELEQWRSALAAGGNAGAIYWTLDAGIMTARLIRMGLSGLFSTVRALPSWAQAVVAGATAASAIYAWKRVDAERTQRLRDAMERIFRLVAAVGGVHQDAAARLESVSAPMPTMRILAEDRSPSEVLTRSVLYQLARSSKGVQSAAELARALPTLPVAQGEGKAREVLRSQAYARQVFRGRWQLGEPVTWPPGQQHTPYRSSRPEPAQPSLGHARSYATKAGRRNL